MVFTANTFHKSGIMAGLAADVQPNTILKLGGWASSKTFWHHYITRSVPESYTNLIFNTTKPSP
jgi:hypothetical protein